MTDRKIEIQVARSLDANRLDEAATDLDKLTNPANLITYNDGYYSRSLQQKWGMSPYELGQLVRLGKRRRRQENKDSRGQ